MLFELRGVVINIDYDKLHIVVVPEEMSIFSLRNILKKRFGPKYVPNGSKIIIKFKMGQDVSYDQILFAVNITKNNYIDEVKMRRIDEVRLNLVIE